MMESMKAENNYMRRVMDKLYTFARFFLRIPGYSK